MCQPGFTFANCLANGRKRLTEQMIPPPLAWIVVSEITRPETDAPIWAQRAGFGQMFVARAERVMFHGGIRREFGVHEFGVVAS